MLPPPFQLEAQLAPPVTAWLERAGLAVRAEVVTPWGKIDLVGVAPAETLAEGGLIAIELKLSRARDVLLQARNNRALTLASYAALPAEAAWRVAGTDLAAEYLDAGVGLLAIDFPVRGTGSRGDGGGVEVVLHHRPVATSAREAQLWQASHDLRARILSGQ